LWATLIVATIGLAAQAWLAHNILQVGTLWRRIDLSQDIHEVLSFGAFTWIKSSLGVLIAYADRLLVAGVLGTGPLAFYALCNQLTQPVPAMLAASFNFIFPNFSAQAASGDVTNIRRLYAKANVIASIVAAVVCAIILCFASAILRLWIGPAVAAQYHDLLRVVAIGNALFALSVVPQYTALAFGRARAMATVNLIAGILSLPVSYFLMQRLGLIGAGVGKILAGAVFLSTFEVARRALNSTDRSQSTKGGPVDANAALDFAR
jgi:O-antigen/teichoic acid export membrane protein